jgi:hypothetical protein
VDIFFQAAKFIEQPRGFIRLCVRRRFQREGRRVEIRHAAPLCDDNAIATNPKSQIPNPKIPTPTWDLGFGPWDLGFSI